MKAKKVKLDYNTIKANLLNKYFYIDGNKATIALNFDNFEDMEDHSFAGSKTTIIDDSLFEKVKDMCELLPKDYEVYVNINIKDIGTHSIEEIENTIIDNINFKLFKYYSKSKKQLLTTFAMIGLGTIFYIIYSLGLYFNWASVITEFLDIACWVFYWEAVSIYFIEMRINKKDIKYSVTNIKKIYVTSNNKQYNIDLIGNEKSKIEELLDE